MPKLTEQQIAFIDRYLENSGVEYLDVRYEMTDHVAAALEAEEGSFDDNFRNYMVRHKKALLASYKKFSRIALGRAWSALLRSIINVYLFLPWLAAFVTAWVYMEDIGFEYLRATEIVLWIVVALHLWYPVLFVKAKFSSVDKLGNFLFWSYLFMSVVRIDKMLPENTILLAYHMLMLLFMAAICITYWKLQHKYKLFYKGKVA